MSEKEEGMKAGEKIAIVVGVLSALVALAVLILGDNVLRLAYKPDIYLNTDSVSLGGLGATKEHVRLFDFYNSGTGTSTNIKVVAKFESADVKFKAESDEEIKSSVLKDSAVEVSLDRLSPRSHVKIYAVSKNNNSLTDVYYIDDNGKSKIDPERIDDVKDQWIRVFAILTVLFIICVIVWLLARRFERRIFSELALKNLVLSERINELKADIADLGISLEEVKNGEKRRLGLSADEVGRRLKNLLGQ